MINKIKKFLKDETNRNVTVVAVTMITVGLMMSSGSEPETTTYTLTLPAQDVTNTTPSPEVGYTHIKAAEQKFGKVEVLSATMDRDPESRRDFVYVEVEGMPCVMHFPQANRGGLSCDWSQWKGKTFEKAIQEQVVPVTSKVVIPDFIQKELPALSHHTQVNTTHVVAPYASGNYN